VRDYGSTSSTQTFHGAAYLKGDGLEEVKPKTVKEGLSEAEGVAWAGMAENYFLLAAVPQEPARTGLRIARHEGMETVAEVEIMSPEFEVPTGGKTTYTANLYLGPKHEGTMAPLGLRLDESIEYGWFGAIGKWFLLVLNVIYRFVGNYGIAIIILTTLVKLALWPLSAKSIQSMSRMRELQPKVTKLKERYGKDPAKLNAEVMQLYKTHKVNPLSGCLPLLVQLPIFLALYRVLLQAIELRHAPFAFWIIDLAERDPYYVTPVLMGLSMYLQQKLSPTGNAQDMQVKIMLYGLPVIFTVMFLSFPAGLVIYWLMSNVLSIGQQALATRKGAKTAVVAG
jgi:YidC/Oxa1 family membrane protein insertase